MIGGLWLFFTVVLVIFSLLTKQVPLFIVALLFFIAGAIARLWARYSLNRVEYRRHLSSSRVFFGEEIKMSVEVTNRKILPLPWLQVEEQVPDQVTLLKGEASHAFSTNYQTLNTIFSLSWYHRIKKYYPIKCGHRGYFMFGPTKLSSGDVFGFFNRYQEIETIDHLMVYPKILPLEKLGIPSRQPLGEIRTVKHLFHDPVLMLGIREYVYGDSLKSIEWKSTARTGSLQTKIFEPTTTVDMGIFLDVRTVAMPLWSINPEKFELAIVTAASLANQALSEDYRVGLYINKNSPGTAEIIHIPPSRHPEQLKHILEALAMIQPIEIMPIARMLVTESRNLPWGSTMVVITASPGEALLATLFRMKRVGRKVVLITIGNQDGVSSEGLTTYNVSDDIGWEKMEAMSLVTKR